MKTLSIAAWMIVILGSGVGLLILLVGLPGVTSAPNTAIACALIPYCTARAVTEIWKANKAE